MRILVTGGAGFIGKSLCRRLLEEGHGVLSLDMVESTIKHRNFKSLIGDITNPKYIDPDYGGIELWKDVDFCFHLAAMANVDEVREHRDKAFKVNLYGTFNIIEACRKLDVPLAFISTACVYGHTKQQPSTEDGPTFPVDWYGVTKLAGEELVKGLLNKYVILRFGTTLGPEMRPALCTYIFLKAAIDKKAFPIRGNGKQTRNWIYIDDLIDGCVKAMEYCTSGCSCCEKDIFNLVGQPSYSVNQLADICYGIVHGKGKTYGIKKLPARPDDVMREDVSIGKAQDLLGWTPKVKLQEALTRIYKEWIKNGKVAKS